ncbi:MAG: adenosylcobalamin-dependent ribonucleoside-diphosphate reductase [Peptostreptococcaceae bacterium]
MNGLTRGMNKDITINEWLRGLSVGINTWDDKYKLDDNETVYEFIKRVSAGDEELMDLIYHQDFLFAGRILASRGLDKLGRKVTLSNCYVITPPEDNIESIFDRSTKMAKTFSMGGGCGIDISKLRPNGAKVNNAAKTTTGAVSFMELFNMATDIIGQKGRRGAAMISLDCTHPDVEEFIEIKSDLSKIEKANISLRMNKLFMDHVISGEDLEVSFNVEATGEIFKKVINPKKLFGRLAEINWDYAEPGILFWDRIESWNMLSEYPDFEYAGTNPCAEEPLPAGGSCLLGSINLSNFVTKNQLGNNIFDMDRFKKVVRKCVRALNDVLDEGLPMHPLQEQKDSVRDWRQIGLGVMGMGDLMIKLGIRYDTQEGVDMLDYIGSAMSRTAIDESCELAKEFGPFPKFNAENTIKSPYIQFNCDAELIEKIKTYGLRNSQLLTTAPTGSISTMIGASGGMEPVFSLYHQRTTKSLNNGIDTKFWIYHRAYLEKLVEEGQLKDGEVPKADNLLELKGDYPYIVTAHTMDPYMRIKLQATWQKYVDASISSTINLHNSATVEDVFNIYVEAWKQGLKGLTIYRDGCKRLAILEVKPKVEAEDLGVSRGEMLSRPEDCVYSLNKVYIGCGELNLMLGYSPSKRMIHDVFVIKSGQGGCEKNIQAQAIYLSGFLRLGGTLDMLESGITGVSACPSFTSARAKGRKLTAGSACPQAILNVIKKFKTTLETCENPYMLTGGFESTTPKAEDKTSLNAKPAVKIEGPKCGKCGTALEFTGGCSQCPNCGETKCD